MGIPHHTQKYMNTPCLPAIRCVLPSSHHPDPRSDAGFVRGTDTARSPARSAPTALDLLEVVTDHRNWASCARLSRLGSIDVTRTSSHSQTPLNDSPRPSHYSLNTIALYPRFSRRSTSNRPGWSRSRARPFRSLTSPSRALPPPRALLSLLHLRAPLLPRPTPSRRRSRRVRARAKRAPSRPNPAQPTSSLSSNPSRPNLLVGRRSARHWRR